MSNSSSLDRESFQNLLASAFVVQQSRMDSASLSAIVGVKRSIKRGELDQVDGAIHLIVDRTRNEANVSGPAVSPSIDVQVPSPALEEDERSSGVFLSYLATVLSEHGPGPAAAADLALDLALKDIVERARLATSANAAAIALVRGKEMVCRATTGTGAPELCVRLDAHSELSGDCIQTSKAQCCDDTEADSRVDAVTCRRLGIRSFLIFPILKQGELVGLVEIFSSHPKAFGDRNTQTLQALSRQVLVNVECATEFSIPSPEDQAPPADTVDACLASFRVRPPKEKTAQFRFRDPWTPLLLTLVSALALLLGWMLGRVTWPGTAQTKIVPAAGSVSQEANAPPPAPVTAKADAAPAQPQKNRQAGQSLPLLLLPKDESPEAPSGSLIVYQEGKVIFRLEAPENAIPSGLESEEFILDQSQAPGEPSTSDQALGFPGQAKVELLRLVQPEYPETARQQHIQGPVVLEGNVGKDGRVQQITVISGNSMLATAAANAVRQWRFKPRVRNGRAVQFQTRIKVGFTLP
jgi:TonB family protein